jgi:Lrp/AsnC family leucine-responsive transcriptional regulator
MDIRDRAILERLMTEGRVTWAELASDIGVSPPSVADRVRKLEERGVIRGYAAQVDPAAVGSDALAFVAVGTAGPEAHPAIVEWARQTPEIQECHITSGEFDYLLKVRCRSVDDLGRFLREELRAIPGVMRTVTSVVLGTVAETVRVPLPEPAALP